jgi:phage tail-like protein
MGMADGSRLIEFSAVADRRGRRINLDWAWVSPGDRPRLRLVRRRRAYPTDPADGLLVLDLGDLFQPDGRPWRWIKRRLYLITNAVTEGGLLQAEVIRYLPDSPSRPGQVTVAIYDPAAPAQVIKLPGVTRIEKSRSTKTIKMWTASAENSAEVLAGQVVVSTRRGGVTPSHFKWVADGHSVNLDFDRMEAQQTWVSRVTSTDIAFRAKFRTRQKDTLRQVVELDEAYNPDTGEWKCRVTVEDMGLEPGVVYYYTLFVLDPETGDWSEQKWHASTMATDDCYRLDERLYELLPAFYIQYDEPTPTQRGQGQLRRFLQVLGLALNQVRSQAEGLGNRHDVLEVRADLLPHLARWIGWEPDRTLDVLAQRNEILFAPEIYGTIGALPNIRALVNRATSWKCQVKEFVHNVFLSNAPETVHLWEIWEQDYNGREWSQPARRTQTESFDGRPACVRDSHGTTWLFWQSDRGERNEIWLQRQGIDPTPRRAMPDAPGAKYSDESPTAVVVGDQVWLFWDSDRGGHRDIWMQSFNLDLSASESVNSASEPVNLTDHPAQDRCPAVVCHNGQVWLFWQSDRRGPTDIWCRVWGGQNGQSWSLPSRVTEARFRHETPAALVDGSDRLWLFWCNDLGDRRNLYCRIHDGAEWLATGPVPGGGPWRDESPAAVLWEGEIGLFWHSNRDGHWQIWRQTLTYDGAHVQHKALSPVTDHPAADKEPCVVADGGQLRVLWRSQRSGNRSQSRTVDFNDAEMLARLRTFRDVAHYTYDTGRQDDDWYARDTIGIFLTPDMEDAALSIRDRALIESISREFLPIQVRAVFIIEPPVYQEPIYTCHFPEMLPQRLIGEKFFDSTIPEAYSGPREKDYWDTVPDWIWIHSNYSDHRTVNFSRTPIVTKWRTQHVGIKPGE